MEIKELLKSTSTADIFATDDETRILVRSKDVAADESGLRTEEIPGKGAVCSRMTAHLYRLLETKGFHTAFVLPPGQITYVRFCRISLLVQRISVILNCDGKRVDQAIMPGE